MKKFALILSFLLISGSAAQAGLFSKAKESRALTQDQLDSMTPAEAAKAVIDSRDINGDSMLIKKETNPRFRVKRFDKIDTSNDGKITVEELATAMEVSRKHRQEKLNKKAN